MLDLKLREEFRGKKLQGTTVDFTNTAKTGALEVSAAEFLRITYPSHDLLHAIEAVAPGQARPVVLLGDRGQGKSHLLAALFHLCTNHDAGRAWLEEWGNRLGAHIGQLKLRQNAQVIAVSLHQNQYKSLWDILFVRHPQGQKYLGRWEALNDKKTEVPPVELFVEMFREQPVVLILDEFQTWFDSLTNSRQNPWRNWAFHFIQNLSEIAENHPELLVLVVSVRDGQSEAYQQIHRVNPVRIDFKGPLARRDRQKLLLYRLFENRMQVPEIAIEHLVKTHVTETLRLGQVAPQEQEKRRQEFYDAWPFAPHLLELLEDHVLVAAAAQETRDLIRILVDLFKTAGDKQPVITAADFSLTEDRSGIASLLDSVANQLHKELREKALRNLTAVRAAVSDPERTVPHLDGLISSLWLRSLSLDRLAGAEPADLQIDVTRDRPLDDNRFEAELATIEENSFNIHRLGTRLIFRNEENPRAKLLSHARNDKLAEFKNGEDLTHLALQVRAAISGPESVNEQYRIVVLKRSWEHEPWGELDEKDLPDAWRDQRIVCVVIPETPEKLEASLGGWLKNHLPQGRNTVRFLLPRRGTQHLFFDRDLIVLARAVFLAKLWRKTEAVYAGLEEAFHKELAGLLKARFDRFALLDVWNFAEPAKCRFIERAHAAEGSRIPDAVDRLIQQELFIPEEFQELVAHLAEQNESLRKLLNDLREPRPGGLPCIPWLGETAILERVFRLCSEGQIAINLGGRELLQIRSGESAEDAWRRIKGKIPTGKHLDETRLQKPTPVVVSGGSGASTTTPVAGTTGAVPSPVGGSSGSLPPGGVLPPGPPSGGPTPGGTEVAVPNPPPGNLFGGGTPAPASRTARTAPPNSGLNLLGQVENWGIKPGTRLHAVVLRMDAMSGAQLNQLLAELPSGMKYGLELEQDPPA